MFGSGTNWWARLVCRRRSPCQWRWHEGSVAGEVKEDHHGGCQRSSDLFAFTHSGLNVCPVILHTVCVFFSPCLCDGISFISALYWSNYVVFCFRLMLWWRVETPVNFISDNANSQWNYVCSCVFSILFSCYFRWEFKIVAICTSFSQTHVCFEMPWFTQRKELLLFTFKNCYMISY
jgi:hypothetical protein